MSCKSIKVWWSSLLEHCPKWGKDDEDYDSPTSRDETSDFTKRKKRKKKRKAKNKRKRKAEEKIRKIKEEKIKWEKKREGTMLLSFYHTCASK